MQTLGRVRLKARVTVCRQASAICEGTCTLSAYGEMTGKAMLGCHAPGNVAKPYEYTHE